MFSFLYVAQTYFSIYIFHLLFSIYKLQGIFVDFSL